MDDPVATRFRKLFQTVETLLSRPDIAALIAPEAAGQLSRILDFARSWDEHASRLTPQQQARCLAQLEDAVATLSQATGELDQLRLKMTPVEEMGKA